MLSQFRWISDNLYHNSDKLIFSDEFFFVWRNPRLFWERGDHRRWWVRVWSELKIWGNWAVWCGPSSTFIGPLSWGQTQASLKSRNADRSRANRIQLKVLIWFRIIHLVCNVRTTVVGTISHQPNLGSLLTSVWSQSKVSSGSCFIWLSPWISNLVVR